MPISDFFDVEENTFDDKRTAFFAHMDSLKAMDVREQTLYKKHQEIQINFRSWHNRAALAKAKIWRPTDIDNVDLTVKELHDLQPRLRYVEKTDRVGIDLWRTLRVFCSSAEFSQNPGRFLRFFLEDQHGNILGITSIASDVMNLGVRDRWIGWTDEQKESGMLNHTAIGTTIVPTQPSGYNFLGGKLLASMLATQYIRDIWHREYDDVLVGLTTTSLYGDGSMYNGIKWWRSMGETTGKVSLAPDLYYYDMMHEVIKKKYPAEYERILTTTHGGPPTGVKQKIMHMIYKECGITTTKYQHGFQRGVYFCPIYENTREFLRQEITKDKLVIKDNLRNDHDDVVSWWKNKAEARYRKLVEENRVNSEILFYNDAISLDWTSFRSKYLHQVGR
jgi:hypothetical protein